MTNHPLLLSETASSRAHDLYFLDRALALAAKGEGQVKPNPLGVVVVNNGLIGKLWLRFFAGIVGSATMRAGIPSDTS